MGKGGTPCEASLHRHPPLHASVGKQQILGGKRGRRGVQNPGAPGVTRGDTGIKKGGGYKRGGVTYTCGGGGGECRTSGSAVFFSFFFPLLAISDAFSFVCFGRWLCWTARFKLTQWFPLRVNPRPQSIPSIFKSFLQNNRHIHKLPSEGTQLQPVPYYLDLRLAHQ